ncbi:hypothetical protein AAFP35_01240 [Gordonia sp. CPCC 206044]|uniref:hypothetical protein n=1 Tax=Gordonia sp. CPCC 206044 TaxID=3140793 RepID=UPI003AF340D0
MSTVRLHRPRSAVVAGLLLGLAAAILFMHSVIAHCVTGGHHAAEQQGRQQVTMQSSTHELDVPTIGGALDCMPAQHACVFIRAGEPDIVILAVLVLAWGFPLPALLRSVRATLILRSGRPPPWAIPTHLQLSVIRC